MSETIRDTMVSFSKKSSGAPGPGMRFFIGRIFPLPFILAGAAVLFFGLRNVNRANNSTHWPSADAVIRESRVASRSGNKGGTTYSAQIRYDFTVNDTVHSGDSVGFGDYGSSDSDKYQQIVNRYPAGSKVRATYMPEDPSVVVLEPGIQGQTWFMPGFGAVFFFVGCAMAVFLPRALRKQAERAQERSESHTKLDDKPPAATHPKVTITKGIDGTVFETRGNNLVGVILIAVAVAQLAGVTIVFSRQGGSGGLMPIFLIVDSLMLAGGAFLLFSRYTVSVSSGKISLCFGVAGKGYRKEITRLAPVTVSLDPRGSSKNNRPLDSIVVRNADGAELHFGPFLDDSRKTFIVAHLARILAPKTKTPANPFE